MLLRHLYDLAQTRNLLDDLAFAPKTVRWIIELDADGRLIGQGPVETSGERNRGKELPSCPRIIGDTNSGKVADFLAEGVDGMFGLSPDPSRPKDATKLAEKHKHFWEQIRQCAEATGEPALSALLVFRRSLNAQAPPFLTREGDKWLVTSSEGARVGLGNDDFSFRVNGSLVLENEGVRGYWRERFAQEQEDEDGSEGESVRAVCLVTGESATIARTHSPTIKKVPDTQGSGAKIVSFEKSSPSFSSFGFKQSYNASVSKKAATAYCEALNWLLSRKNHSLRIGRTAVCFWAKDSEEASDFFAEMLDRPQPESVRDFLRAPWAGVDRSLLRHDEFYSVTLSGNAGRIIVRHWMQSTVEAARENLRRWFADLEMATYGDPAAREKRRKIDSGESATAKEPPQPLALYSLAVTTVREAKDLQAETLTQLYRAAVEGLAPPLSLLKPLLHRLDVDLVRDGPKVLRNVSRFALLRLTLNRNRKESDPVIELQVFDTDDAAYNCGRLLAVFNDLQMRAHEFQLEGAGVVERYYGSASSAPNSAFGILWRLHQHHLKKVSRQGDKGKAAAEAIKRRIAEIACRFPQPKSNLPPSFPRTFNLQEQGRFALGFYQQKAADDAARRGNKGKDGAGEATPSEN